MSELDLTTEQIKRQRRFCLLKLRQNETCSSSIIKMFSSLPKIIHVTPSGNVESTSNLAASPERKNSGKFTFDALKDLRWISAWNLWIDTTKLIIHSFIEAYVEINDKSDHAVRLNEENDINTQYEQEQMESWERFKTYLAKREITGKKAKKIPFTETETAISILIKNIDKLSTLLNIWELTHRRSVTLLSFIQITTCEHKTKLKKLKINELLQLELIQEKFIHEITVMTKIIEKYYAQLSWWIDEYLKIRIDERHDELYLHVLEKVSKFQHNQRQQKQISLDIEDTGSELKESAMDSLYNSSSHKTLANEIQDFHNVLFVRKKNSELSSPKSKLKKTQSTTVYSNTLEQLKNTSFTNTFERLHFKYTHMVEIGIEWYLCWITFTASLSRNYDTFLPSARTMWKQIVQLKTLHQSVIKLGKYISQLKNNASSHQPKNEALLQFYKINLDVFAQFITFFDTLQLEMKKWSSYFDELSLNEKNVFASSATSASSELSRIQAMIAEKQQILSESLQFLYKEILAFVEYVKDHSLPILEAIDRAHNHSFSFGIRKWRNLETSPPAMDSREFFSYLNLFHKKYGDLLSQKELVPGLPDFEQIEEDSRTFPLVHSDSFNTIISKKSKALLSESADEDTAATTRSDGAIKYEFLKENPTVEERTDYWSLVLLNQIEFFVKKLNSDDLASFEIIKRKNAHKSSQPTTTTSKLSSWFGRTRRFFSNNLRKLIPFSKSNQVVEKKSKSIFVIPFVEIGDNAKEI